MSKLSAKWITLALCIIQCSAMKPGEDEQNIRAARASSNTAIASHQAEEIAKYWTEDYHLISSRNAEARGRQVNMERFQSELQSKPDVIYIRTPKSIEVFPDWKMAAETGTWEGRWTEGADHIQLTGSYFAKWHKVDGKWLIRGEIFVPLACKGGKFCEKGPI